MVDASAFQFLLLPVVGWLDHHLDVIKVADHVIDLGPEGGHAGGEVVVTGTPEAVAACKASHGTLSEKAPATVTGQQS